jgi:hypothetical protein
MPIGAAGVLVSCDAPTPAAPDGPLGPLQVDSIVTLDIKPDSQQVALDSLGGSWAALAATHTCVIHRAANGDAYLPTWQRNPFCLAQLRTYAHQGATGALQHRVDTTTVEVTVQDSMGATIATVHFPPSLPRRCWIAPDPCGPAGAEVRLSGAATAPAAPPRHAPPDAAGRRGVGGGAETNTCPRCNRAVNVRDFGFAGQAP